MSDWICTADQGHLARPASGAERVAMLQPLHLSQISAKLKKVCQREGQWCLRVYTNHPWSVTEPEAVGVPGWQTGAKALCLYSQSPQACKPVCRAPTWLTTALVEWNELHTILALGAWQTLCPSQWPYWV